MNYIGSKYSLLDFLGETIDEVTGNPKKNYVFADLFAGTGTVGAYYRAGGACVIANDIQYYSYVLNRHYIENTSTCPELLYKLNKLDLTEGFIYRNYCRGSGSGRNYFTDENGKKCDAVRTELERLYLSGEINKEVYFHYLASLINSLDKYANTASVYGAFLKHTKKTALRSFELELLPIVKGEKGKAYNEDANELIGRIKGDVLYLDPPYNQRQYSANYHLLETVARYDSPKLRGMTGLRAEDVKKSRFCSGKTAAAAFCDIIERADFKFIFLSYNNEGLMPLSAIREIMSKYGKYSVFTKEHRRFKADRDENRTIKEKITTEYLHCLKK